jgi:hypothetical protein
MPDLFSPGIQCNFDVLQPGSDWGGTIPQLIGGLGGTGRVPIGKVSFVLCVLPCTNGFRVRTFAIFFTHTSLGSESRGVLNVLVASGHTTANTPDLFRTLKLTAVGPG